MNDNWQKEVDRRLKALEDVYPDLHDIKETIDKLLKYIKVSAPTIVAAAISAGIVNGKLGAFLSALIYGMPK